MGKQHWKAGNMLNPVPAVMVSVSDGNGKNNIITLHGQEPYALIHLCYPFR